jgi:DNA primase
MAKQNFITRFKDFFLSVETELEKSLYLNKLAVSLNMEKEIEILRKILITENKGQINFYKPKIEEKVNTSNSIKINELERETLKLVLKDIKYFEKFKNKTITSPFVEKIFNLIKENGEKNYIQELLRGKFFKLEEDEEEIILDISAELSSKSQEEIKNTYVEIYKRWFIKEIEEKMIFYKSEKQMISFFKCQKIKVKISEEINIEELEKVYGEFISMKI